MQKTGCEANTPRNKALELEEHGEEQMQDRGQNAASDGLSQGAGTLTVAFKVAQHRQNGGYAERIDDNADDGQHRVGKGDEFFDHRDQQGFRQHDQDAGSENIQEVDGQIQRQVLDLHKNQ